MAKVLTPAQAHCTLLKQRDPDCYTVFIGPCIAKKQEADSSPMIDTVLTYDELRDWMADCRVQLPEPAASEAPGMLFPP